MRVLWRRPSTSCHAPSSTQALPQSLIISCPTPQVADLSCIYRPSSVFLTQPNFKFPIIFAPAGTTCDGLEVLQAAFRGRELKGAALPLPEGYSGAVLEKREPDTDGVANAASWQATSTFDSFTYWNHDATPLQSDGLRRCLEWAHIAAALHQPTSVAQVEALLADPARDKANKAEHASQ